MSNTTELTNALKGYLDGINAYQASSSKNYVIQAEHMRDVINLLIELVETYLKSSDDTHPSVLEQLQNNLKTLVNDHLQYRANASSVFRFKTHLADKYDQLEGQLDKTFIKLKGDNSLTGSDILMGNYQGAKTLSESLGNVAKHVDALLDGSLNLDKLNISSLKTLNQDLISAATIMSNAGSLIKEVEYCTTFNQEVSIFSNMQMINNGTNLISTNQEFAPGDYDLAIRLRLRTNNTTKGLDGTALVVNVASSSNETQSWNIKRKCLSTSDYKTIHIPITHKGGKSVKSELIDGQVVDVVEFDHNLFINIDKASAYAEGDALYIDSIAISPITVAVYDEVGTSIIKAGE